MFSTCKDKNIYIYIYKMSDRTPKKREVEYDELMQGDFLSDYHSPELSYRYNKMRTRQATKSGDLEAAALFNEKAEDAENYGTAVRMFGPGPSGEMDDPDVLKAIQQAPASAEKAYPDLYNRYVDKPYRRRTGEELNDTFGKDSGKIGLFESEEPTNYSDYENDEMDGIDNLGFNYNEPIPGNIPGNSKQEKGGKLRKKRRNTKRKMKRTLKKVKNISKRNKRRLRGRK
jgi:hypothetical protein